MLHRHGNPAKPLAAPDKSAQNKLDESRSAAICYGVAPPISIGYRLALK